jgi:hypothetical protein
MPLVGSSRAVWAQTVYRAVFDCWGCFLLQSIGTRAAQTVRVPSGHANELSGALLRQFLVCFQCLDPDTSPDSWRV